MRHAIGRRPGSGLGSPVNVRPPARAEVAKLRPAPRWSREHNLKAGIVVVVGCGERGDAGNVGRAHGGSFRFEPAKS